MRKVIADKRLAYTLFLKKQLSKNADRIQTEKVAVANFSESMLSMQDKFKSELEQQLEIITAKR